MKKAFTLIELLVVIAIIAILATIVIVQVGNAKKQADDSRMKADLSEIMTAMEMYNSKKSSYPTNTAGGCGTAGVVADVTKVCGGSILKDAENNVYIQRLPKRPDGTNYTYSSTDNYTLSTKLSDGTTTWTCSNGSCY